MLTKHHDLIGNVPDNSETDSRVVPALPVPVSDTGAPKILSIVSRVSHAKLMKWCPDFQVRASRRRPKTEASAEHTSPFYARAERENFRIRVHNHVEICKFRSKARSTDAEHVSTVDPGIARE